MNNYAVTIHRFKPKRGTVNFSRLARGVVCQLGLSVSDDNGAEEGKAAIQLWIC